ncbi:hypothetical protein AAVH_40911, partial [Aphelenchoides avenae]
GMSDYQQRDALLHSGICAFRSRRCSSRSRNVCQLRRNRSQPLPSVPHYVPLNISCTSLSNPAGHRCRLGPAARHRRSRRPACGTDRRRLLHNDHKWLLRAFFRHLRLRNVDAVCLGPPHERLVDSGPVHLPLHIPLSTGKR